MPNAFKISTNWRHLAKSCHTGQESPTAVWNNRVVESDYQSSQRHCFKVNFERGRTGFKSQRGRKMFFSMKNEGFEQM